jgi:hypothetical protein
MLAKAVDLEEETQMKAKKAGEAGLIGWRGKTADAVAGPIAERTALDEEAVRSLIGAAFFLLAAVYVAGTIRRLFAG